LFEWAVDNWRTNDDVLHVWSCNDLSLVPESVKGRDNVVIVKRHTLEYMTALASAGHIIGNSILPKYFVKQREQKYLNTWHGIGYKRLGRHPGKLLGGDLSVTNLLQATHVISPCAFMTDVFKDSFSMRGPMQGSLAEVGYPRVDRVINPDPQLQEELRTSLGLDPVKKTIVYAPTWRGDAGSAKKQIAQLVLDLKVISSSGANVVFVGHHLMNKYLKGVELPGVVVPPAETNTNDVLALSDVVITDYSSVYFDVLAARKPIIHYLYDYRGYAKKRGLALELEDLPGHIAFDSVGLGSLCRLAAMGELPLGERYETAVERFAPYDSGHASADVGQWFFEGKTEHIKLISLRETGQRSVAFWGGRLSPGEHLESYLEELRTRAGDPSSAVTLVVARSAAKSPGVKALLKELGTSISIVSRSEYEVGMTSAEWEARQKPGNKRSRDEARLYDDMYRREYHRVLGNSSFHEVVMYPGLTFFWKKLGEFITKS
jgi:CDP-glycerol glycerophosphotransferase